MHSVITYLIYAAVVVRTSTWYVTRPPLDPLVMGLLAAYGVLLVTEPPLTRRLRAYPWIYLALQTLLTIAVLLAEPELDFLVMLFLPLSFQAVLLLKPRAGFLWIGAFFLAMFFPAMSGFDWKLSGLAMTLGFGGIFFLIGGYAHLIQRAGQAQQQNQRLLEELQEAHRRLQDSTAQAEELAAVQERSHLVRELHDSVTQTIFSMNLAVQSARMCVGKDPAQLAGQLDRLQELARSASGEIQVLARHLQPRPVSGQSLPAGLRMLAAERERRDGLRINLQIAGEKDLPDRVVSGLYRITQEALNNVDKHAGTREAYVRLDLEGSPAFLEVEDHGCGFEIGEYHLRPGHMGLAGMAERAGELGWKLKIDSHPGRGTRIRLEENPKWPA